VIRDVGAREICLRRFQSWRQSCGSSYIADARLGENARLPAYTVNEDAVRHAKRLIERAPVRPPLALAGRAAARTGAERVPEEHTPGTSTPPGI
jgi:hypothetical protein